MINSLDQMIAAVKREIAMRGVVYPGRVANKKMSQPKADQEIAVMTSVLTLLREIAEFDGDWESAYDLVKGWQHAGGGE